VQNILSVTEKEKKEQGKQPGGPLRRPPADVHNFL